MYKRLNLNRKKSYYKLILEEVIKETEIYLNKSPEISLYRMILNQLKDIELNIVKKNNVFSEDELYNRYSLGAIAVKNFDLETDEYGQKLSDIFGGTFDYYLMPE